MSFLSSQSKLFAGLLCLALVTVEYGGHFLLSILKGTIPDYAASPQFPFFRAGHAHAGVWVILGLAAQPLIDTTRVSETHQAADAPPVLCLAPAYLRRVLRGCVDHGRRQAGRIALAHLRWAGEACGCTVLLGVNLIRGRG
jgi:hypothetical protein